VQPGGAAERIHLQPRIVGQGDQPAQAAEGQRLEGGIFVVGLADFLHL
jgi:hypothetical protein